MTNQNEMKFKNFLKNGVLSVVIASSLASAFAQPINTMVDNIPNRSEIVQIVKDNVPNEDLAYLVQQGAARSDARTEAIYQKINETIEAKYGSEEIQDIKQGIEKQLKEISDYRDIPVSYSWAMPKEIIQEYKDAKQNDSSVAYNAMDISGQCKVVIKLAVDNNGRIFEASELSGLTTEDVSAKSNKTLKEVISETMGHEMSHCVLQEKMKDPGFEMSFSKDFKEANPTITKILNEKINLVKTKMENNDKENIDYFDYLMFSNYNENFADVAGAFARLGNNPTASTIKDVRDNLIELSKYRESTELTHKTQVAVQSAIEKLDEAAKMTPEKRVEFAKEIAGDSLLDNMQIVFGKVLKTNATYIVGSFLVDGLKIEKNGTVTQSIPEVKEDLFTTISEEYDSLKLNGGVLKKVFSHEELVKKYESSANAVDNPTTKFKFNYDEMMSIRENSFGSKIEKTVGLRV
jgi:hypothetical protein